MYHKILIFFQSLPKVYKIGLLLIFAVVLSLLMETPKAQVGRSASLDTFIPKGHVLVPIRVENYESLDSVLGPFGVVDLYEVDKDGRPSSQPTVKAIRILRSPQKPDHFAVLAPESKVHQVMENGARFQVVLKNPDQSGTEFVDQAVRPRVKILVED